MSEEPKDLGGRLGTEGDEKVARVRRISVMNRGIGAALVVGASLFLTHEYVLWKLVRSWELALGVSALLGFVSGAIVALGARDESEDAHADPGKSASDALVTFLLVGIFAWAAAWLLPIRSPVDTLAMLGAFAGGSLLGALAGAPIFVFFGKLSIKGVKPFQAVNHVTRGIRNPTVRFLVRVAIQTLVFSILVAAAATAAVAVVIVVAVLIALWIAIKIILAMLSDEDDNAKRQRTRSPRDVEPRVNEGDVLLELPEGSRITDDGRVVKGWIMPDDTGIRIADDGRILKGKGMFKKDTGLKINKDGRLVKGAFEKDTRIRIKEDGRIVQGYLETDTGFGIDKHTGSVEQGFFVPKQAGIRISKDGKVESIEAEEPSDGEK